MSDMNREFVQAYAPGRINIIGEHTDYNDGFVLPAAIDKTAVFKLNRIGGNHVSVTANNVGESFKFDLQDFNPTEGGWQNYVMGVVDELQKLGGQIDGFEAEFDGDVPIGSGMSSSAALECSLAIGLNELFKLGFDKWQLIKACQKAEHNFVGIKCGVMDQFASIQGRKNHAMFLDCRSLEFEYIPVNLGKYQLVLLNSNVTHSLASSEYNTRRSECEQGVSILRDDNKEIESLRDVSLDSLQQYSEIMPETVFKRCLHVVSENTRVLEAVSALRKSDLSSLGKLMYQSHFSLQDHYEVSCPELDYLVQLTLEKDYVIGSRMMGGGFGGCTINLIETKCVQDFVSRAAIVYHRQFGIELTPYSVAIGNGAGLV